METKRVYPMKKFKPIQPESPVLGDKIIQHKTDSVTGEIVETIRDREEKAPKTPDFGMIFTQDLGYLKHIQAGDSKLLFGLFSIVDRNNEITLNKARKKMIGEKIGISVKTIDSALNRLKKNEILIHIDRGVYKLNPYIFGKGQWKNIHEFRMELVYNFDTEVKTEIYHTIYHEEDESNDNDLIEQAVTIDSVQEETAEKKRINNLEDLFNAPNFVEEDEAINSVTQNSELRDLAYGDLK